MDNEFVLDVFVLSCAVKSSRQNRFANQCGSSDVFLRRALVNAFQFVGSETDGNNLTWFGPAAWPATFFQLRGVVSRFSFLSSLLNLFFGDFFTCNSFTHMNIVIRNR